MTLRQAKAHEDAISSSLSKVGNGSSREIVVIFDGGDGIAQAAGPVRSAYALTLSSVIHPQGMWPLERRWGEKGLGSPCGGLSEEIDECEDNIANG